MLDKKLLEQAKQLKIDINIENLKEKGLPDEVINDILDTEINEILGNTGDNYTYEELAKYFQKKFNSKAVECIS